MCCYCFCKGGKRRLRVRLRKNSRSIRKMKKCCFFDKFLECKTTCNVINIAYIDIEDSNKIFIVPHYNLFTVKRHQILIWQSIIINNFDLRVFNIIFWSIIKDRF